MKRFIFYCTEHPSYPSFEYVQEQGSVTEPFYVIIKAKTCEDAQNEVDKMYPNDAIKFDLPKELCSA